MIIPLGLALLYAWILTTTKGIIIKGGTTKKSDNNWFWLIFFSELLILCQILSASYLPESPRLGHIRIACNAGSVLLTEQGSSKLAIAMLVNQWKEQQQQRQEQQQQHGRSSWRTNFSQKPFLAASETEVIIIPHLNCLQKAVSSLNWYKLAIPKMIILSFMFLLLVLDDQIEDDWTLWHVY